VLMFCALSRIGVLLGIVARARAPPARPC
jgi:hypothetical protein